MTRISSALAARWARRRLNSRRVLGDFGSGAYRLVATTAAGERSWPFTVAEGKTTVVEAR